MTGVSIFMLLIYCFFIFWLHCTPHSSKGELCTFVQFLISYYQVTVHYLDAKY